MGDQVNSFLDEEGGHPIWYSSHIRDCAHILDAICDELYLHSEEGNV